MHLSSLLTSASSMKGRRIRQLGIFSAASGLLSDEEGATMAGDSMGLVETRLEFEFSSMLFSYANSGNYLTFVYFTFLIYKMEIVITSTQVGC